MIKSSQINLTDSSNIFGYGYDKDSKQLGVVFKSNPSLIYVYDNVDESTYEDFNNADSKGSFFYKTFRKPKYPYTIISFEL